MRETQSTGAHRQPTTRESENDRLIKAHAGGLILWEDVQRMWVGRSKRR